ncbi:uncharacterized protein N7515_000456 [Penicillium bovifimosum]|uniref:Mid2 domain-containing protein n=1 Tax=Penicillium bovifimosum TaxID=126998 RepID=A0A9W9HI48_9EURO|nr:uncharacterized protein N7515_000456 [Penicillium bovifimosum]KAJ5145892.1 hypothetical protein N7515_000456 [Penicillium bovifimosum]
MVSPLLFLLYFTCLPSVSAWIFSWHNPDGKLLAVQNEGPQDCRKIDNPKGNVFDWSPIEGHWCIFLYTNSDCKEPSAGHTCKTYPWSDHASGQHILSFQVKKYTSGIEDSISDSPSTTDANTSSAPTATTPATTDASDAASSSSVTRVSSIPSASSVTSASASADEKHTISGGAIAGIVIGVLAAVAIAGIVVFLIWRRRRNSAYAAQSSTAAPSDTTSAMAELPSPAAEQSPIPTKPVFRELHGSAVATEIAGAERYELSGTEIYTEKKA